mmetsp:Transcript_9670/g.29133  ORF Transcript_9670/g.29133 Transcript_9670/m.29133 type:complete len:224 (+) Transcript_9670:1449-2120(+)
MLCCEHLMELHNVGVAPSKTMVLQLPQDVALIKSSSARPSVNELDSHFLPCSQIQGVLHESAAAPLQISQAPVVRMPDQRLKQLHVAHRSRCRPEANPRLIVLAGRCIHAAVLASGGGIVVCDQRSQDVRIVTGGPGSTLIKLLARFLAGGNEGAVSSWSEVGARCFGVPRLAGRLRPQQGRPSHTGPLKACGTLLHQCSTGQQRLGVGHSLRSVVLPGRANQ